MKIGITGATGQLGRLVIGQLKQKTSDDIIALVRTPEKASDLNVEVRVFDYNNAEELAISLHGIDHLLLISSSEIGQRFVQHKNVIEAAQKAQIKWIVYTSVLHADTSSLNLAEEHRLTEKLLKESGISYTLLRNGWYTENYNGSVAGALKGGVLAGSAGDGKVSSASRADFAEAAAVVLSNPDHKGKVYELAGDEAYTLTDLAAEISKQTGKKIPYKNLPESEYAQLLKSMGFPDFFADSIANWDISISKGDLYDTSGQLSNLIGRSTTSMADSLKEIL